MDQGCRGEGNYTMSGEGWPTRDAFSKFCHSAGVARRVGRFQISEVGECQGDVLELVLAQVAVRRFWLQRQDRRPHRLLLEAFPEARTVREGHERGYHRRVESPSPPPLGHSQTRVTPTAPVQAS